jgi:hypothetical protein
VIAADPKAAPRSELHDASAPRAFSVQDPLDSQPLSIQAHPDKSLAERCTGKKATLMRITSREMGWWVPSVTSLCSWLSPAAQISADVRRLPELQELPRRRGDAACCWRGAERARVPEAALPRPADGPADVIKRARARCSASGSRRRRKRRSGPLGLRLLQREFFPGAMSELSFYVLNSAAVEARRIRVHTRQHHSTPTWMGSWQSAWRTPITSTRRF